MKFNYQYRTKDNTLHSASINAVDKETAYSFLKKQGIKPSRMEVAPGFLNNFFGRRRRWVTIFTLSFLLVTFTWKLFEQSRHIQSIEKIRHHSPRHQIYGDPELMESICRGDMSQIVPSYGDQILGWYAQPALLCAPGSVKDKSQETINFNNEMYDALHAALNMDVEIDPNETREYIELKQIINGMKLELRAYLSNGVGTVESYCRRLNERLKLEMKIQKTVAKELEHEKDQKTWQLKNENLRKLGIRTIPMPEEIDQL